MKLRLWRPIAFLALVTLPTTTAISAHASTTEGSFDRTLKITGPVDLDVTTGSGHIDVRTGDAASLRVHGTIRASTGWHVSTQEAEEKVRRLEANPPIEQNGNVIRIGRIEDRQLSRNVSISYELVVPVETRLHSQTGSGNQTIEGVRGPVNAGTGSGSLRISNIGDELRASTGSGDIRLDSVKGSVHASTGSGSIRAIGIAGGFVASTGSGDVKLEQTTDGDGKVETGSGSVELTGVRGSLRVRTGSGDITAAGEPKSEWNLHTGSGGVTVHLPPQAAFDLDAETSSGHISTEHPITIQGTVGRRGELRGKVRGGGFRLEVRTGSGNIRIE